jgi:uncharacterized protein YbjT (DUF2867 family)
LSEEKAVSSKVTPRRRKHPGASVSSICRVHPSRYAGDYTPAARDATTHGRSGTRRQGTLAKRWTPQNVPDPEGGRSREPQAFTEDRTVRVLVAGSHGQVGQHIVRMLAEEGHEVRAMIRDEDQAPTLRELGGEPVVADLEGEVAHTVEGCDAVIFSAGGGPGSGAEKKETVDRQGAVKLIEAAKEHGARRYVMVSAMGAADPEAGSEAMQPYLFAKARADASLQESGLDYTIVRPGSLTDDPGDGTVEAAPSLGKRGEIPREDTARTIVATLKAQNTYGKTFEVLSGGTPVEEAIARL